MRGEGRGAAEEAAALRARLHASEDDYGLLASRCRQLEARAGALASASASAPGSNQGAAIAKSY